MSGLDQTWCCINCAWLGPFKNLIIHPLEPENECLHCPRCKSRNLDIADGQARHTDTWMGDNPAVKN